MLVNIYHIINNPTNKIVISTFTNLSKNLTASSTVGIGELAHCFPSECSPHFQNVINSLLKISNTSPLILQALLALRLIFSTKHSSLSRYIKNVLKYLKKTIENESEYILMMSIKLMKSLIFYDSSIIITIFEMLYFIISKNPTLFIISEISRLISYISLNCNDNSYDKSLTIIKKISAIYFIYYSTIFETINPTMIQQHYEKFFDFIKEYSPTDIDELIIYGNNKINQEMFNKLLIEKPNYQQVIVMNKLINKEDDLYMLCSVCSNLSFSKDINEKNISKKFFNKLSKKSNRIANEYLKSTILSLINDANNYSYGFVVMSILEGDINLINSIKDIIVNDYVPLINKENNFESYRFIYFWGICSFLSIDSFDVNLIGPMLKKVNNYLINIKTFNDKQEMLLNNVLLFLTKFNDFNIYSKSLFEFIIQRIDNVSYLTLSIFIDFIINCINDCNLISTILLNKCKDLNPGKHFLRKQIQRPMIVSDDILIKKKIQHINYQKILAQNYINKFPQIFKKCNIKTKETILQTLIQQNTCLSHSIILQIIKDGSFKELITHNFIGSLLKTLKGNDYLRIQITCESISYSILNKEEYINGIIKFIEMNKISASCLLISSVMCQTQLEENFLSRIMLFINEKIFSSNSTPFALHALSTMFITQGKEIKPFCLNQLNILLQLLHNSNSLHPLVLYLIYNSVIDLINNFDLDETVNITALSILVSFSSTPFTLSKGITYETFVELKKKNINFINGLSIKPIKSQNVSHSILLSSIKAFSYISNTKNYIKFLPKIMVLIKKINNGNMIEFVVNLISKCKIDLVIDFIYNVFKDNLIPEVGIEPNLLTKIILLKVLDKILTNIEVQHVYKIVVSLCITISSNIFQLQEISFPILGKINELYTLSSFSKHFEILFETALNFDFSISGSFITSLINVNNLENCSKKISNLNKFDLNVIPILIKIYEINKNSIKQFIDINYNKIINLMNEIFNDINNNDFNIEKNQFLLIFLELQNEITPNETFKYFINKLSKTNSETEINELIKSSMLLLNKHKNEIEIDLIKDLINISIIKSKTFDIKETISDFCFIVTKMKIKSSEILKLILNVIINIDFKFETFAYIIENIDNELIKENINGILSSLLHKHNEENEKLIISLFILLIKKNIENISHEIIKFIVNDKQNLQIEFELLYLIIIQQNIQKIDFLEIIKFSLNNLKNGALLIGRIICNKEIKFDFDYNEIILKLIENIQNNFNNSKIYFDLLILCMKNCYNNQCIKIALKELMKIFPSLKYESKEICVNIFKHYQNTNNEILHEIYEELNEKIRESIVKCLINK